MLDRETDTIIQKITERTIGDRESITLKEAISADIPKGIKTYLHAVAVRLLSNSLGTVPALAPITDAASSVSHIARPFLQVLSLEHTFSRDEYTRELDGAVRFLMDFLCRPQKTLEQHIFGWRDSVPIHTAFEKLEYVSDYAYFGALLKQLIRRNGWTELTLADFHRLLARIETAVVQEHNAFEMAMLTKPIFDLVLVADASVDQSIPLEPLLQFYEDKKMSAVRDYIERICHMRSRPELSLGELIGILEDLQLSQPYTEETGPPTGTTGEQGSISPTLPIEVSEPPEPPHRAPYPQNQMASRYDTAVAAPVREEEKPSVALNDLHSIITGEQKAKFVRRIFKKDDAYYAGIIEALNKRPTWKEASMYLKVLYEVNGLDPFSADVVEFTDTIQSRYTSRS